MSWMPSGGQLPASFLPVTWLRQAVRMWQRQRGAGVTGTLAYHLMYLRSCILTSLTMLH